MPPIRSSRNRKPPPEGFEDIEDTLLEFANKMKDGASLLPATSTASRDPLCKKMQMANPLPAEAAPHEGKRKNESVWDIFRITHQRSRYIYDLYYKKEAISKDLYNWLLKNKYADADLIAKWKKQGYEKLCCLRCIQAKENNFGATCICRVPKARMNTDQRVECVSCGCRGCASGD